MKKENGWIKTDSSEANDIFKFCDEYISFLNDVKTEREATSFIVKSLVDNDFKKIDTFSNLKAGDKVFFVNKNKSVYAAVIGSDITSLNIIGAHIDSPRLDLKPNPLYESLDQALFKTHYYGGIKKYQWTCIPLSMRGVICKTNGDVININIGEKEDDPIFTITDLLPHLARAQEAKKLSDAIEGESLNILIGNISIGEKDGVKENVLNILKDKYNIVESDFLSAEIEFVPAFKAKSLGFDKSMVAAYGQDDRVCAYTLLRSLINTSSPKFTSVAIFADKEEIGSMGNTGMMSNVFDTFITKILIKTGNEPYVRDEVFCNSKMLSADVGAAADPNYQDAFELNNASLLGHGVEFNKYTGGRGKSSSSDANSEYFTFVRGILEKNNIKYQVSELGKVDLGGGGTIAYIIANKGVDVIDCGVPILSMHSPYEVASKFDIYMAYRTYSEFYKN